MELHEIPGFAAPPGAVIATLVTADRARLRCVRWTPSGRVRGTVAILQGRSEMIERYYEVIGELLERGLAVAIFDWRGQGGSGRALRDISKGHIGSFAEYDRDLEAFLAGILPECPTPHFALAHSMGGLVCVRSAHAGRARFQRMLLSAPMIAWGPTRPSQANACRIAATLTRLGLGGMSAHGEARETIDRVPFEKNDVTGDPARYARNAALAKGLPQVFVSGPTYGWLHAACRAMREADNAKFAAAIRIPTLLVAGSIDNVVSVQAMERFASNMRAGSAIIIPGGRHELMMEAEPIRAQFWAAFDAFIPGSG